MDVSNLIPAQNQPTQPAATTPRTKGEAAAVPAKAVAAVAAAGAGSPRPASPATSISDRIERSPELKQRVAELRRELEERTRETRAHVAAVGRELLEAKQASHDALREAAAGILLGELRFLS